MHRPAADASDASDAAAAAWQSMFPKLHENRKKEPAAGYPRVADKNLRCYLFRNAPRIPCAHNPMDQYSVVESHAPTELTSEDHITPTRTGPLRTASAGWEMEESLPSTDARLPVTRA